MRRVVVVTTSFPQHRDDAAGCFVEADARALDGVVDVVCVGPRAPCEWREGLRVHRVGGDALFGWPGASSRLRRDPWRIIGAGDFAWGARRKLRELRPFDAVVAHWLLPSALLCRGYPLERAVAHGADVRLLVAMPRALRDAVMHVVLGSGARIQFVAHALRDALVGALSPSLARALARVSFVEPCPLDMPEVVRVPGPVGLVVCGRLVAGKRVALTLEVAAATDTPLVIIGDGPLEAELRARAAALGVRATFTGRLPRGQALGWIAAADALLSCSLHEAAPTAVREARALGVPVVATPAGDLVHWASRDPGILVVPPRVDAIVSALQSIEHLGRGRERGALVGSRTREHDGVGDPELRELSGVGSG
jgi:glycosyltransferase involved in cell wall biosynthesis